MTEKIFGWILLVAGVSFIGWGIINSINIFTAKKAAPEIFSIQTESALNKSITGQGNLFDLQGQIQNQMQ